jgi:hypothetical protein
MKKAKENTAICCIWSSWTINMLSNPLLISVTSFANWLIFLQSPQASQIECCSANQKPKIYNNS